LLNNKTLIEFIKLRFKKNKLTILDEGAGLTIFLKEIKALLIKESINVETTAITLTPEVTKKNSNVDVLIKQDTLKFKPSKSYDLIFSVFGGVHYNLKDLDKNLVLKLSHSLSKNGVFFLGLNRLSDFRGKEKPVPDYFFTNIKKSFNKNGFDIEYESILANVLYRLPIYVFKITRK